MPLTAVFQIFLGLVSLELLGAMDDAFQLRRSMLAYPLATIQSYCSSDLMHSRFAIRLLVFHQNQWVTACGAESPKPPLRRWRIVLAADPWNSGEIPILNMQYLR